MLSMLKPYFIKDLPCNYMITGSVMLGKFPDADIDLFVGEYLDSRTIETCVHAGLRVNAHYVTEYDAIKWIINKPNYPNLEISVGLGNRDSDFMNILKGFDLNCNQIGTLKNGETIYTREHEEFLFGEVITYNKNHKLWHSTLKRYDKYCERFPQTPENKAKFFKDFAEVVLKQLPPHKKQKINPVIFTAQGWEL